ncbi:MAG: hypothetical protein K1X94_30575 [Sandaracinaceae bacterium]|nr:hypothetical protein [Sandaracinaceae bacterium]
MRTTIEITDAQRARLLELAARRGVKGFSPLVQEAVELYLEAQAGRTEAVRLALAAIGSLDEKSASSMRESVKRSRESWR